jgi:hypothetical protein
MSRYVDKTAFFNEIKYKPHMHQMEFHRSGARFRVPCCGRRFGKSIMAARDLEPELFLPRRRYWAVGPTYDLAEKEFRVIWDDLIVRKGLGKDNRVKKAYSKKQGVMFIEFPWQTRIEVRSADHPENLVGEALHGVIMSEAAKQRVDTWEKYIRPSLADYRGWATFPTTPEGFNWLYDIWAFGNNPDQPDYESWRFPSWENHYVYPEGRQDPEILLLEQTTTPEWFLQEIGADFASFVGKIYGEWDETIHVKRTPYNPMWKNYIFIDWGFVNPFCALDVMVDPQDNVYVWREHYKPYMRLEDHLIVMGRRDQPTGYHIDCCFGDAADPEATLTVNKYFAPCMSLPEAKSNWRQGIDTVKRFLKTYQTGVLDEYGTPKYEPKLFVDPSCVNLIREMNNYRAVKNLTSATREDGATSAAQKQDDHALDALRYGLVHIFELGAQHHLREVMDSTSHAESSVDAMVGSGETFFTMDTRF